MQRKIRDSKNCGGTPDGAGVPRLAQQEQAGMQPMVNTVFMYLYNDK